MRWWDNPLELANERLQGSPHLNNSIDGGDTQKNCSKRTLESQQFRKSENWTFREFQVGSPGNSSEAGACGRSFNRFVHVRLRSVHVPASFAPHKLDSDLRFLKSPVKTDTDTSSKSCNTRAAVEREIMCRHHLCLSAASLRVHWPGSGKCHLTVAVCQVCTQT